MLEIPINTKPLETTRPTASDRLTYPHGRLENLARLVNMCMQTPECLDLQTMHMILRIEEWLGHSQRRNPYFLSALFMRPAARSRVIRCAHNPAYVGHEIEGCLRNLSGSVRSVSSSVDLDEKVRYGNLCRVEMITYDKYNTFDNSYFIAGAPVRAFRSPSKASVGSGDDWSRNYPLHRAAYVGDAAAIEPTLYIGDASPTLGPVTDSPSPTSATSSTDSMATSLLALGVDARESDRDSWTPLHYAAFYEHLDAMRALLNSGNANRVGAELYGVI
ncbi:unnamed protein product [Heligmosomoides polygyrus]|uniref:ANK_REP_REGION domain-containing protein n=1 Tax=Heligmosomoides polygyrus TaxID=6339 RepID=A0A183G0W5_HELPZ|nr:unnamed protein product [Heligmosomoides polygyrus]